VKGKNRFTPHLELGDSVVGVFGIDFEFFLAGFANPVMFAVNKRVVVDAFAVVVGA
jgi:hypothetical protein